ncbi:MAG: DUF2786 domain-containing protein [Myxococcales bacterium]|nr:DUF2786 domain-containing protein [Myxococcales bacterium]
MNRLTASLHRTVLRQLRAEWQQINLVRLGGRLRPPTFKIDDADNRLGSWHTSTRTLTLASGHLLDDPWREVRATLRHEVAHQVVDELMGGDHRPHGRRFAKACELLNISTDGANLSDQPEMPPETARVLSRIRKLLALAESDNPHEAEVAMATAHRLLLAHNLRHPSDPTRPDYVAKVVGRSSAAIALSWKLVGGILEEFFFVQCVWSSTYNVHKDRMERELEVIGRRHDVDMASWVHDFLHGECERLWRKARKSGLATGRRGKREYVAGVLLGFRDKLRSERTACEERGLVWVGDADLQAFTTQRFPSMGRLTSGGVRGSQAHAAGREHGADLKLHRPVSESDSGRQRRLEQSS